MPANRQVKKLSIRKQLGTYHPANHEVIIHIRNLDTHPIGGNEIYPGVYLLPKTLYSPHRAYFKTNLLVGRREFSPAVEHFIARMHSFLGGNAVKTKLIYDSQLNHLSLLSVDALKDPESTIIKPPETLCSSAKGILPVFKHILPHMLRNAQLSLPAPVSSDEFHKNLHVLRHHFLRMVFLDSIFLNNDRGFSNISYELDKDGTLNMLSLYDNELNMLDSLLYEFKHMKTTYRPCDPIELSKSHVTPRYFWATFHESVHEPFQNVPQYASLVAYDILEHAMHSPLEASRQLKTYKFAMVPLDVELMLRYLFANNTLRILDALVEYRPTIDRKLHRPEIDARLPKLRATLLKEIDDISRLKERHYGINATPRR